MGNTVHPQKSTIYNFGNKYFTIIDIAITDFQCNMAEACPYLQRERMDLFFFFCFCTHFFLVHASKSPQAIFSGIYRDWDVSYFADKQPPFRKLIELSKLATQFKHSANTW